MPQSSSKNRRVLLAAHPQGEPTLDAFRIETGALPAPGDGQMLLRTEWLSLDPYMRVRMFETDSYMPSVKLGQVMVGGTVSRVEASNHPDYKPGDRVQSYSGWQDYAISDGSDVMARLPADMRHPSWYLGALGMPGFTAWYALNHIGKPKAGETFVVGAATGAVGQIIGQFARPGGCRVVGIAGGADKCAYAVNELGFDACIDHRAKDLPAQLASACPKGIDIYMENVGGAVLDAVRPLLANGARIPVCGQIAHYSGGGMDGTDRLPGFMSEVLFKRIKVEGFIIFDHYPQYYADFVRETTPLLESGKLKSREHFIDSLEAAPQGLIDLLQGGNFGKVVVKVA
jgi:NADPH-dependent curcumin reductase